MKRPIIYLCAVILFSVARPETVNAAAILVIHPDNDLMNDVASRIRAKLSSKFKVSQRQFNADDDLGKMIKKDRPALLIALDNMALISSIKYNNESTEPVSIVAAMSLNLKQLLKKEPHATGIAYEIPPFLLANAFNKVLDKPIRHLGVIYRPGISDWYIAEAREQLKFAKVTLQAEKLPESSTNIIEDISNAYSRLQKKNIDAFWLLSDNGIINQETFPTFSKLTLDSRVPFLCGVKHLVSKALKLCSFSVTPDLTTIVDQGVDQAMAILDDKLSPRDLRVEYLESVNQAMNIELLEASGNSVAKDRLGDVEIIP